MEIASLTLLTNNLTETKIFYEHTIGFSKIKETETNISFAVGTSQLIFELSDSNHKPNYHFAFNIPSNKINEALEWMLQRTSLISTENNYVINFENWNAKAIYFYDNNHNILEFISRADLNNDTDEPFSIKTILSINEVGLVTDEPLQTAATLLQKTNINFFKKGPRRTEFVAVGDEHGLFVISNPTRNWYPTQRVAEKWKVKTIVKTNGNVYELGFN